ncbi:peptide-methionine (S)-S-oxide reductase [Flavobacterium sp. LM5]|uniref:peptide-methionine (S)-S-oxide reductase MsrA n=1 Tax=Flavobacterium sp. LM5 TaxID=1938610 RepID=UPI000992562E|nr:peptide-methionine (S)-S-oxide reductase MsrA [Flavobacterium sp. LM5]OOV29335.1 peptide-methionine (S)-S-oxide reductase [Flavobacterium sp. LM5]
MKKIMFLSLLATTLGFAQKKTLPSSPSRFDTIVLAGGCYWCVEAVYENLKGVQKVVSGFTGGTVKNPSYEAVSSGATGAAEVVQITFNKNETNLDEIFKVFFTVHDPTTLNRQGADVGTQYRSAIFFKDETQKKAGQQIIQALTKAKAFDHPIVTTLEPLTAFYKAKDSHQDYYEKNQSQPYCQLVIQPKLEKFEKVFKNRIKAKN